MYKISNQDYITVNKNGIFVAGKPATTYRGEEILFPKDIQNFFNDIQEESMLISDVHVLLSETAGKEKQVGKPVGKNGKYVWSRVVLNGVPEGDFVCSNSFAVPRHVASDTLRWIRNNTDFRLKLLRTAKQEQR